ncbi:MAG: TetR/AcrR family transcriptional regulator [Mycobacterium sp.]
MGSPRQRMVASAALLIRERGAHSTAIADVLAASGAPRGSAYHYFPGGRTQLICEAVDFAADYIAGKMAEVSGGVEMLDHLVAHYRKHLIATEFRAGCPVLAVAIEADPDNPDRTAPTIDRAAAAFDSWNGLIVEQLVSEGITKDRAHELAVVITASLEGALVLAQAARSVDPLDVVHRQLRALLLAEKPEGN